MLGTYVHVPFCSIKCFYCDFAAFAGKRGRMDRYLAALEKEFGRAPDLRPETLYVGGGTPSELSAPQLDRLLEAFSERFGPIGALAEATVEANPESLDREKLKVLRSRGVGRLSLGLQATQDRLLKAIGRRHDYAGFRRVFEACREEGFDNLSVDLMFGLPGQSLEDLRDSVRAVAALGPEHVSAYGLQVEERTHFAKREVEVDEDLAREMFEAVMDGLAEAGYRQYEVSNFAKPGREAVHNTLYWKDEPYHGFGVSAASFVEGRRWTNLERLDPYLEAVEAGRDPAAEAERLEGKAAAGERVFLGLRLSEGFEPTAEARSLFERDWRALEAEGMIEWSGPRARLTREGLCVANRVFERFVAPFEESAV